MKKNMATVFKTAMGLLVASAGLLQAQTYTNTDNATGTTLWSAGAWDSAPVSSSTTVLTFIGGLSGATTLQNDLGVFNLTTLNDNHTGTGALTLSGNQLNFNGTSNLISFNSSVGDTISAAINFSNGLTVNVSPFLGYTISGAITGSGGLIKNGVNGSLTLSGANSYTGGTILNGNSLILGSNTALGTGAVLLNSGTLSSTNVARSISNALQIGGNIAIGNGNQTFAVSGGVDLLGGARSIAVGGTSAAAVTLSGVVSNGALVKESTGTLLLTNGANTYAGGTTINNGVLQFASNGSAPSGGNILINNGGALAVNSGSGRTTVAGWLSSGLLDSSSTGTIAMNGNSGAAIDFSANGGYDLFLGAYVASTLTGTLTANGTTYRLGGGGSTLTLSNTNALTGTNSLLVGPALRLIAQGTPNGAIANAQSSAGGTVVLSGANDMSGTTNINSGTLTLSGAGSLINSDTTIRTGASLTFSPTAGGTVGRVNSVTMNGGTLGVTGAAFATTDDITNSLTLNSGANTITVTPNANGSSTLTAASLSRTSGQGWALVNGVGLGKDSSSTINVGRIILDTAPTLVGTTAALSTGINASAKNTAIVPWLVGATTVTTGGIGTAGVANTFLTYEASTGLRPLNLTDEFTNNSIATGTNTYINTNTTATASDSINSLVFLAASASTPALSLNNGVTLTVSSGAVLFTPTTTNVANAGTIMATGGTATLDFGAAEALITVQNPATSNTTTGTISTRVTGSGGLSKFGGGILALTNAANTYTGVTAVNNGILSVATLANGGSNSSMGASGSAASNLVLNGGTLRYTGSVVANTDRLFEIGLLGGGIQSNGTAALNFTNTGALGFNGESGARTFVLTGSSPNLTNIFNPIIGDNGGPTTLIRTVNATAQNTVWILGGLNTYTGATMINGDTNNQGGGLSVSVLANGGVASGIGASSNAASNLLINRGSLIYTGAATSTDRLFTIGNSGGSIDSSGTGALNFTNTGAIAFTGPVNRNFILTGSNTGANTMSLLLSDSGATAAAHTTSFTKNGAGTWALTNANTYTGVTTIGAGTLSVSSLANGGVASNIGASSSAASNLLIGNGSTLRYTGSGSSSDRLFTLNGSAAGHSATLEASGTGALNLTNTGSLAYGTVNQTRVLNLNGTNTGTNTLSAVVANNGTGATSVNKNDAGTWVLAGANTYTGATTVNAGTLLVNGTLGNTAVTVNTGGKLGGSGSIAGAITLNSGGAIAPGNSPGTLTGSALTWNGGGLMNFELGSSSDLLSLSGTFTKGLAGTYEFAFTEGAGFGVGTYTLVNFGSTTFSGTDFSFSGLSGGYTGTFIQNANDLQFQVAAVPEPSTYALIGLGLVSLWVLRRRNSPA